MRIAVFAASRFAEPVTAVLRRLGHRAYPVPASLEADPGCQSTARRIVGAFADADLVVTASGSTAASIRQYHTRVAGYTDDRALRADAAAVTGRVHELSELIVDRLGITDIGATFHGTVAHHAACHSQPGRDHARRLLGAVRGLELVPAPSQVRCCDCPSFDGNAEPANSRRRAARRAVDVISLADSACLPNFRGCGYPVRYLAELLAGGGDGPA